jgi:putative transposase
MPRPPRVVCPGVPYHVTQRGSRRGAVFFNDHDRSAYLDRLRQCTQRAGVEVLAYCLMGNHVHLVAVPAARHSLERALRPLHARHAQRINRLHNWKGHVWQGRYFAAALDDRYMWAAIRYVELNPVRAGLVTIAHEYAWSSAASHCGLRADSILTTELHWKRILEGVANWSTWLLERHDQPTMDTLRRNTKCGVPCGSDTFVESMEREAGVQLRYRPPGRPRKMLVLTDG